MGYHYQQIEIQKEKKLKMLENQIGIINQQKKKVVFIIQNFAIIIVFPNQRKKSFLAHIKEIKKQRKPEKKNRKKKQRKNKEKTKKTKSK